MQSLGQVEKLYAVGWKDGDLMRDGFPRVFKTWGEAEKVVKGRKGGIKYKRFASMVECAEFLGVSVADIDASNKRQETKLVPRKLAVTPAWMAAPKLDSTLHVYTDGGCDANGTPQAAAGFGVVVLRDDAVLTEVGLPVPFDASRPPTNIIAELCGVKYACTWLLMYLKPPPCPVVFHVDLMHIMKVLQEPRNPLSVNVALEDNVRELMRRCARVFPSVDIVHVKGHSGDVHNERADALATRGKQRFQVLLAAAEHVPSLS